MASLVAFNYFEGLRKEDEEKIVQYLSENKVIRFINEHPINLAATGDIATCYCNLAKAGLGWEAKYDIEEMCRDSLRFQKNNPNGYEK